MTAVADVPEYPSPSIVDSRRLMGANVYSASPGSVLEVRCDEASASGLLLAWQSAARTLREQLGWGDGDVVTRQEAGGASLFMSAPVDVLMTATEVNEQAWTAAERTARAPTDNVAAPDGLVIARLRELADGERATRPMLAGVYEAAAMHGLCVTFDDETCTLGSGTGASSWPLSALPGVEDVPWHALHDVPIALVTGSNGKTTTTRLLSAMWRAAGRAPGWCCSDGVWLGDRQAEMGDFSGPAGARAVLRDPCVEAAVLETARGGMLRRGLAVSRADAAIITNISADHFGEYGIASERDLADAKATVARVLGRRGLLVLNADDPELVALASRVGNRVGWFSVSPEHAALDAHVHRGGNAATVFDQRLMLHWDHAWHDLGNVNDMPITLRGAAPHNVQNVLGAALLATAVGVPVDAVRSTLASFGSSVLDNPGRLQVLYVGGVTVITDYAHNPDGLGSLCHTALSFSARRRMLVLGQAGNRDDDQLRALVRAAWAVMPFDEVVVKEMPGLLRGRPRGEMPKVFADELTQLGLSAEQSHIADSEFAAAQRALSLATVGDLVVCPLHAEQAVVLSWFQRLIDAHWRAGSPFPDSVRS